MLVYLVCFIVAHGSCNSPVSFSSSAKSITSGLRTIQHYIMLISGSGTIMKGDMFYSLHCALDYSNLLSTAYNAIWLAIDLMQCYSQPAISSQNCYECYYSLELPH